MVSILIVTHNHEEYIEKLLNSLVKFNYKNVFICDAASSDGTVSILKSSIYKDNLLLKTNLEGFSKNNNDLIRKFQITSTKYIFLLNPDTYIEDDVIKFLESFMEKNNRVAIAAPKILYPNGSLQLSWKKFPNFLTVLKKRLGLVSNVENLNIYNSNKNQKIEWALGAALFIRSTMLNDMKILDERYRLYCEDSDICLTALDNGFEVWGVSDAIIYHALQEKSSKNIFSKYNLWNLQSIFKFFFKWNIKYFKFLLRNNK